MASGGALGRRAVLRGAAAVGAALAVPAAGGCADDDDTLTFFFQAKPDEARVRLQIVDEFRKLHPDIKIRTQLAGPDPQQQILTYSAGGKCPDVLMAWESYSRLADLGVLSDLNTMLDKDPRYAAELKHDSHANLYDTFGFKGRQYALPEQWAGVFLYYNRRLFAEAGVAPPPVRWSQAWTFEQFLDAAKELTRRDSAGKVTQWGFVDPWEPFLSAGIFGMNNGTEWFTPPINPTRTNMDDDAFIEGYQFYADLSVRHEVAPKGAALQTVYAGDLFTRGKAAMALTGHWMYSAFAGAPDLDFDVTVLPRGPRARRARSDVGTTGLAIAADSPRKQQAWEFVKFATGPVGQAVIARSGLFVPVLKSAVHSAAFAESHSRIRNIEVLTGGPDNSDPLPVTPAWGRIGAALRRGSDRVLRGAASADGFKHGLVDEINELLAAV